MRENPRISFPSKSWKWEVTALGKFQIQEDRNPEKGGNLEETGETFTLCVMSTCVNGRFFLRYFFIYPLTTITQCVILLSDNAMRLDNMKKM